MDVYLIALAAILRIIGGLHDGMSSRKVSWILWHCVNWLKRDAIIIAITYYFVGAPWGSLNLFMTWVMWAGLNIFTHRMSYWMGEKLSMAVNAKKTLNGL